MFLFNYIMFLYNYIMCSNPPREDPVSTISTSISNDVILEMEVDMEGSSEVVGDTDVWSFIRQNWFLIPMGIVCLLSLPAMLLLVAYLQYSQ